MAEGKQAKKTRLDSKSMSNSLLEKSAADEAAEDSFRHRHFATAAEVLSIFLVRQKVLREFLSAKDLLVCRQVSRKWSKEATAVLQLEKFERALCLTFRYSPEEGAFVSWNENKTGRRLQDLLEDRQLYQSEFLLKICTLFEFQGGNLPQDAAVKELFKTGICGLIFNPEWASTFLGVKVDVMEFAGLLLDSRRLLKYLHIKSVPHGWCHISEFYPASAEFQWSFELRRYCLWADKSWPFPALEILRIISIPRFVCSHITSYILLGAPNVRFVSDRYIYHQNALFKKPHLLHSWLYFADQPTHAWINKLRSNNSDRKPFQLQKFGITLPKRSCYDSTTDLVTLALAESCQTLRTIWNVLTVVNYPGIVLPGPMTNVTKVTQQSFNTESMNYPLTFSPRQQNGDGTKCRRILEMCPNARHFSFNPGPWYIYMPLVKRPNKHDELSVVDELYNECAPMPKITMVTVSFVKRSVTSLTVDRMNKIRRHFPNLRHLRLSFGRVPQELPELLRLIWTHFSDIRSLSLKFRYNPQEDRGYRLDPSDSFLDEIGEWQWKMDEVITGLDRHVCAQLAKAHDTHSSLHPDTLKRNSPSLFNLKYFESLRVQVSADCPPLGLFSNVSFHHGFDLMKGDRIGFSVALPRQVISKLQCPSVASSFQTGIK